jgi:hypothetical protein
VLQTLKLPGRIIATGFNRTTVALADEHGRVVSVTRSGESSLGVFPGVTALAFAGKTLLIGVGDGIRAQNGGLHIHVPGPVRSISTGGGRFLVRMPASLRVYTDAGKLVSTIHTTALRGVLSPGGLGVATTRGKIAQLWDASTGKLLHTLRKHGSLVTDAEYSPNGRQVVTVSDDHKGRIWSVRTGRLLQGLVGHFFPVYSGSYNPDGRWIVTASQFTAGLWNARTGKLLFYLGRDTARLTGASFSPTGNWILTGSQDGTARVYHCLICQPLAGLEATARARLRVGSATAARELRGRR